MEKNRLIHEIGKRIVADISSRAEWAHLVLVTTFENDGSSDISGIAYDDKGEYEGAAPEDFEVHELVGQLRDAMAAADKKAPWRACLIRIEHDTGRILFEFEYEKPDRWQINLKNFDERARELRPASR